MNWSFEKSFLISNKNQRFFITVLIVFIFVFALINNIFGQIQEHYSLDHKKNSLDFNKTNILSVQEHVKFIVDVKNINLYKILIGIKACLISKIIENAKRDEFLLNQEIESAELTSINNAISLLEDIIERSNSIKFDEGLELLNKMIRTYNFLENKEISPRILRSFVEEIDKFDRDISRIYSRKKYLLSDKAKNLFIDIRKLNHMLKQTIIKEDFFDFTMLQFASDMFFHRPLEFASKHKIITCGIVGTLIGLVVAWYGYPYYVSYKLANKNQNYNCHQLNGFYQPKGSGDCGYFAAAHTLVMMSEPGNTVNVEQLQGRLNNIYSLNTVINNLRQVINGDGQGWIHGDNISAMLRPDTLNRFANDFANLGVNAQNINFEDIHLVEIGGIVNRRAVLAIRHPNEVLIQRAGFLGEPNIQAPQAWFANSINRFRNLNRPQGFIISLGNHWVAMRLQRDEQGIIQPILADSLWLENITNNQIVNHIIQLYNELPADGLRIETAYGHENIAPSLDNIDAILNLHDYPAGEVARYNSMFNHFARALQSLGAAENRNQELNFYRDRLDNLFHQIRNGARALGNQHIASDLSLHVVDLNHIQTLDQCIFVVLGHNLE